jgi:hypothetical protein
LLGGNAGQRAFELPANNGTSLARFPFGQQLADADNRDQTFGESDDRLLIYVLIRLFEDVPPLAVAEDYVRAADVDQHRRADFAGESAVWLVVKILPAKSDLRALHHFADRHEIHERRADQQVNG